MAAFELGLPDMVMGINKPRRDILAGTVQNIGFWRW